jgi:branched-chain amino acid transport system substrate-binding protein
MITHHSGTQSILRMIAALVVSTASLGWAPSLAQGPITIGFAMPLSGPLGGMGRQALVGMKVWESNINGRGGLLGRQVKLLYYDSQSVDYTAPAIYSKLLSIDNVDLIMGGFGSDLLQATMPVAMMKKKVLIGLHGLNVNSEMKYDRYFSMIPTGADPNRSLSRPFFETVMRLGSRPKSIAIVANDAEPKLRSGETPRAFDPSGQLAVRILNQVYTGFVQSAAEGARQYAKELGFNIVYSKSYPASTSDIAPIIRAVQATNPDVVFVASYPVQSIGVLQAVATLGLKTQALGGVMMGLQWSGAKTRLGEALNGVMNHAFWVPAPKMMTASVEQFLKEFRIVGGTIGVDTSSYDVGIYAYASIELLGQAVENTKSLNDSTIADYLRANTHETMIGSVKFGKHGELEKDRMLLVQYRGIKGNEIGQFKGMDVKALLYPANIKTGESINFLDARK